MLPSLKVFLKVTDVIEVCVDIIEDDHHLKRYTIKIKENIFWTIETKNNKYEMVRQPIKATEQLWSEPLLSTTIFIYLISHFACESKNSSKKASNQEFNDD